MADHTPIPWKQYGAHIWSRKRGCICEISDLREAQFVEHYPARFDSERLNEAFANAAFIVKAVNNHDALVEALRELNKFVWDEGFTNVNPAVKKAYDLMVSLEKAS